jgi:diacylglycerol O-acyltransferase / wax synthase
VRSHLSPLDQVFLEIEQADDKVQMQLAWAAVFEPTESGEQPSLEKLREQVRRRLVGNAALRRRLSIPQVDSFAVPIWLPDPDFDVGEQVCQATLPAPGNEAQLMDWIGDYIAKRLDRSRPLWEVTLVDGLEDGAWALVGKFHQCMGDGISAAYLVASLIDLEPETEIDMAALAQLTDALGRESERGVLWRVRGAVGEEVSGGIDADLRPPNVASIVSRSRERTEKLAREELPAAAPTSLNGSTGMRRRVLSLETPLVAAKAVKRELGGRVDDVVLAATAGGLRRLFEHRGEEVETVRVAMPVSMRRAKESLVLGNGAAPFFFELPISDPDPLRRYRRISATAQARRKGANPTMQELIETTNLNPALVQCIFARLAFTPGLFNLTVASIPTAPIPLYALGCQMRHGIPLGSLFSGHNLGVAAVTYGDKLSFGLAADHDALPDLGVLQAGIEESLAELGMVAA